MASVPRSELMRYCRVDGAEMGDLVVELAESAEAYLQDAGCTCNQATRTVYTLAVKALALHYLDHPEGAPIPQGIQNLRNKRKFVKPAAETAAGT